MSNWYHIIGLEGHQGAGKSREVKIYIWGEDIIHVLEKYRIIPRVKKNKLPYIKLLDTEKSSDLEQLIKKEGRISIHRAKKDYYLTSESHKMIIYT